MQRNNTARRSREARSGSEQQPHGPCAAEPGGLRQRSPRSQHAPGAVISGGTFLDAAQVAAELLVPLATLRRMAAKGEYPELLHVTRGAYRVRASEHEAWMASRWTKAEQARAELAWERVRAQILSSRG